MNTFYLTETSRASKPGDKPTVDTVEIRWIDDPCPDVSYLKKKPGEEYYEEDKARLDAYYAGDWRMTSCRAVAVVSYPINDCGDRRLQKFSSAGLYGIESDADEGYKTDVVREQLDELCEHLRVFGVNPDAVWTRAGVTPPARD